MAVIADRCPDVQVTVVDVNQARINSWKSEFLPVYEPGLKSIINKVINKNLHFSEDIDSSIRKADCVFISVNTPTKTIGHGAGKASDLKYLEDSARRIAIAAEGHTLVVEKSTLPVRSADIVKTVLHALGKGKTFDVLSNPEFMAEGSAIKDLLFPDRVLIGGESTVACASLSSIYENWVPKERILQTNIWSSEMAKLASNAFLAQRVSSINSLSAICELTGADIEEVARVVGKDSRIGDKFLRSGPGFGGSCFKKDLLNLIYLCEYYGLPEVAAYWQQVIILNEWQKQRIPKVVAKKMLNNLSGKCIAILGFAFKKDTDDTREAPSISICRDLLMEGAELIICDPKVKMDSIMDELKKVDAGIDDKVKVVSTTDGLFAKIDGVILLTEWEIFSHIDWVEASKGMRQPAWVFDARGCLDREAILAAGLNHWAVGKSG